MLKNGSYANTLIDLENISVSINNNPVNPENINIYQVGTTKVYDNIPNQVQKRNRLNVTGSLNKP